MSVPYPQQPAGQPAVPAQPAQAAQPVQQVVPQAGVPYSLAPQRQVPEKISRLSFIFAIIGLGVLVLSLLYCAYIVFTAVHSDHPEGGGFVWIIPFVVYIGLLPTHQSCRSDCWLPEGGALGLWPTADVEPARYRPEYSSLGDRCSSSCRIRTSSFPGAAGAVMLLG